MGWLGKIIGGAIGFAMGGPLGAIAGAAFGHAFVDMDSEQYRSDDYLSWSHADQAESTFFLAAFSMLAKLVSSDGNISRDELRVIERFMTHELRLDFQSQQVAIRVFNAALASSDSFESYAHQFYQQFRNEPQMLRVMVDLFFRVSVADGVPSAREEALIESAAKIFGISREQLRVIRSRHVQETNRYYAVLESKPTDSDDEIKRKYRKLVREYHPDTITAKGLPQEFIAFAQKKFVEIQEAYELVKKERGMK